MCSKVLNGHIILTDTSITTILAPEMTYTPICPSCGKRLSVHAMHCNGCQTHIEGNYSLPVMMQLSAPDQQFVLDFVKSSGSLKEMAHKLGLSYPTVRNRLDDIISQLNKFESDEQDS